jgi:hypothetical protein
MSGNLSDERLAELEARVAKLERGSEPGPELTSGHDVVCAGGGVRGRPHADDCPCRINATPVDNNDVQGYVDDARGEDQ